MINVNCQATDHAAGSMAWSSAPDAAAVALFATMVRLRRFEEKAGMLYALGTLATPCPLGIGQEAAHAAVAAALGPTDAVVALNRSPALDVALGTSPAQALQSLVPAASATAVPPAMLRLPGEAPRLLAFDDAMALANARSEFVMVVTAADDPLPISHERQPASLLPVMVTPADRKPAVWPLPATYEIRECDGADAEALCAAMMAARADASAEKGAIALAILTPPYAGHARAPGGRSPSRRDTRDPVALLRQNLIASGRLRETDAAEIETTIRDEIAAAGRAIALSCAP